MVEARLSVVVPARNAERTLGRVLEALARELSADDEVLVVDDGSTDATVAVARAAGARLVHCRSTGSAGAARNAGWARARGDVVVFLDADAVVRRGWGEALRRSLAEHRGAVVGGARIPVGSNGWSWAAQLQVATPWLPQGEPRAAGSLPAFCLAVPRDAPIRWDETFGGEDGLFAVDALAAGLELVFDPRFAAVHDEYRTSFADVRAWHRRLAYGLARCGRVQHEGLRKRVLTRLPVHHFALARLPILWRRVRGDEELRRVFLRSLPHLVVCEWSLGIAALRWSVRRPPLRAPGAAPRAAARTRPDAAPPPAAT